MEEQMKRYIAFLRGVNISGKNKVDMTVLREELIGNGFYEVSSYMNSGNLVFSTEEDDPGSRIGKIIKDRFELDIPIYVIEADALHQILKNAPSWWNSGDKGRYDDLIFILSQDSPEDICRSLGEPSDGLERIQIYDHVIFWTFDRKLYQKRKWWKKTASAGIAEKLTIRTAATVIKVCGLAGQVR